MSALETEQIQVPDDRPPGWANSLMRWALTTPGIQSWVGQGVALLTFTGRRSGKRYTIPVSYQRSDDVVTVVTKRVRKWWHNFETPAEAELRIAGHTYAGKAELIQSEAEVSDFMVDYLAKRPIDAERAQIAAALEHKSQRVIGEEIAPVRARDLRPGEEIVVDDGEIIPIDGTISAGAATLRPWLTAGGSVECAEGDIVVAGARVLKGRIRVVVFGHATLEHALTPRQLSTAKCVLMQVPAGDEQGAALALLAARIRAGECLDDPQALRPLPLSGIPGWHDDNRHEDFYRSAECFRPLRPGRVYPAPMRV